MKVLSFAAALALLACASLPLRSQELTPVTHPRRPITFADMYHMGRVADPQPSPDGTKILYTVTWYSVDANNSNTEIYWIPAGGGQYRQLTREPGYDGHPRWSSDGKTIAFISSRSGSAQVWIMDADGANKRQVTDIPTGASGVEWSPKGNTLLFTSQVFPSCTTADCNKRKLDSLQQPPRALVTDHLPYRVWVAWKDGKYSHVFSVSPEGGTPKDLTTGPYDTPPIDLGSNHDYALSPDGTELAFVKNTSPSVAWGTNNDIWLENADGSNPHCITAANKANDNQPQYSPDGRYIAYRSMSRPGYESDKYDLKVYDRVEKRTWVLTTGFDRSVDEIIWRPTGKSILFTAPDGPYVSLFEVPVKGGDILRVLKGVVQLQFGSGDSVKTLDLGTTREEFSIMRDNKTLVFTGQRMNYPTEVMTAQYEGDKVTKFVQVTNTNHQLLEKLDMPEAESFTFKSFDGTPVQGWILKPPGFVPGRKYPLLFLVHGGPQGVWRDEFHYRWNSELFASPGYVVVEVNCRGSVGFGQKFTDGVNRDWGGAPYKDLMTGLDYVLKTYPFIDKNRMGAAGASYGGYMMDWFLGHTKRFKAIFSHAGVYDLFSMYGGTEELWFPEWEFGGTPYQHPKLYEKWSPSRFAKDFSTPTFVSCGQLDFRVPCTQSMQLFTALQRQGIESKFMYFPDEGHLVLKPRNAQLWYREFHAWFKEHLMK